MQEIPKCISYLARSSSFESMFEDCIVHTLHIAYAKMINFYKKIKSIHVPFVSLIYLSIGKNNNTRTVQAESSDFASVLFDQGFQVWVNCTWLCCLLCQFGLYISMYMFDTQLLREKITSKPYVHQKETVFITSLHQWHSATATINCHHECLSRDSNE
jgi:hypothetical protein